MGLRSSGTPAPIMSPQQGKRPVGSGHISTTVAARARPTSSSRDQLLPLLPALVPLFPRGGLQRGSVVTVGAGDGIPGAERRRAPTLGFALLAAASTASWCAAVGTADPGMVAWPSSGWTSCTSCSSPVPGPLWAEVAATLFDGMDVVLVRPPGHVRPGVARRLAARARERRGVLVVLGSRGWPEGADVQLTVEAGAWQGVEAGHGHLQGSPPGGRGLRPACRRPAGSGGPVAPGPLRTGGAVGDADTGDPRHTETPTETPTQVTPERAEAIERWRKKVQRLLAIWCPGILEEQEHGREARAFGAVVAALEAFATRVDPVRPGVCAVPTRGPSRYFGGDEALAAWPPRRWRGALAGARRWPTWGQAQGQPGWGWPTACSPQSWPPGPRRTNGPVIVPPGETPSFLVPWPVADPRPARARRSARPAGDTHPGRVRSAARPPGARPFRRGRRPLPAGGPGDRRGSCRASDSSSLASAPAAAAAAKTVTRQVGFWGDSADADARAARAVAGVQELLGPEAVVRGRLQGGRGPAQRARLVPWTGRSRSDGDLDAVHHPDGRIGDRAVASEATSGGPWPGQVPPPAPAVVLSRPLPTQLTDDAGRAVGVTGGGMATAVPARLSVAGGPWVEVTGWAGPWPSDERWWSVRGRRRQARMQVVTAHTAHLLTRERGGWWLEATYD